MLSNLLMHNVHIFQRVPSHLHTIPKFYVLPQQKQQRGRRARSHRDWERTGGTEISGCATRHSLYIHVSLSSIPPSTHVCAGGATARWTVSTSPLLTLLSNKEGGCTLVFATCCNAQRLHKAMASWKHTDMSRWKKLSKHALPEMVCVKCTGFQPENNTTALSRNKKPLLSQEIICFVHFWTLLGL